MPGITKPTRTGYTFGGYYTGTGGTGTQYYTATGASARTWNIASTTTLYAHWTPNQYTVTLNATGGTGGDANVIATYDAAMPAATMPTKTGYIFNGYYDAVNGGTQYYYANGSSARTWNIASDTSLYAQWTPKQYVVTLDADSGSPASQSINTTYDSNTITGTITNPIKPAFIFAGWYTSAAGGDQIINDSKVLQPDVAGYTGNDSIWIRDGDAALHAHWTPVYNVTVDQPASFGTFDANPNTDILEGTEVTVGVTSIDAGYHLNWTYWHNVTEPGILHAIPATLKFNIPGSHVNVSGDFKPNVTTVKFHANNGTGIVEDIQNTFATTTIQPAENPKLFGYTYIGWNVSDGGWKDFDSDAYNKSGTWNYIGDHNGNLDVYANFTVNLHNLSVNKTVENGSIDASPKGIVAYNTTVTLSNTANAGYHFVQYDIYNTSDLTEKVTNTTTFVMPDFNVTVTGYFHPNVTTLNLTDNYGAMVSLRIETFAAINESSATPITSPMPGIYFGGWNVSDNSNLMLIDLLGDLIKNRQGYTNESGAWVNTTLPHGSTLKLVPYFTTDPEITLDAVKTWNILADYVNSGFLKTENLTVRLGDDLDFNGTVQNMIGNSANPFLGTFDGNGHTFVNMSNPLFSDLGAGAAIRNVQIRNASVSSTLANVGLLANNIASGATVEITNVDIADSVVSSSGSYVGSLVGSVAAGSTVNITGQITTSNLTVSASAGSVGGLVGTSAGTVTVKSDATVNLGDITLTATPATASSLTIGSGNPATVETPAKVRVTPTTGNADAIANDVKTAGKSSGIKVVAETADEVDILTSLPLTGNVDAVRNLTAHTEVTINSATESAVVNLTAQVAVTSTDAARELILNANIATSVNAQNFADTVNQAVRTSTGNTQLELVYAREITDIQNGVAYTVQKIDAIAEAIKSADSASEVNTIISKNSIKSTDADTTEEIVELIDAIYSNPNLSDTEKTTATGNLLAKTTITASDADTVDAVKKIVEKIGEKDPSGAATLIDKLDSQIIVVANDADTVNALSNLTTAVESEGGDVTTVISQTTITAKDKSTIDAVSDLVNNTAVPSDSVVKIAEQITVSIETEEEIDAMTNLVNAVNASAAPKSSEAITDLTSNLQVDINATTQDNVADLVEAVNSGSTSSAAKNVVDRANIDRTANATDIETAINTKVPGLVTEAEITGVQQRSGDSASETDTGGVIYYNNVKTGSNPDSTASSSTLVSGEIHLSSSGTLTVNTKYDTAAAKLARIHGIAEDAAYDVGVQSMVAANSSLNSIIQYINITFTVDANFIDGVAKGKENLRVYHVYDNNTVTTFKDSALIISQDKTNITVRSTEGFSYYVLGVSVPTAPQSPSAPASSGSSRHYGATVVLPVSTEEPTVAPTQTQSPDTPSAPTASATTQPTQQSPAPLTGLIAGLGAAALVLARLRR